LHFCEHSSVTEISRRIAISSWWWWQLSIVVWWVYSYVSKDYSDLWCLCIPHIFVGCCKV